MGIRCLTKFVRDKGLLEPSALRDCHMVIDGSCCTGWAYHVSGGEPAYGGDYDLFAQHVKQLFEKFTRCNITCHVVFAGGHSELDMEKKLIRLENRVNMAACIQPNCRDNTNNQIAPPMLQKVVMDVLDGMNIAYIICLPESEGTVIALAKHLGCPILSYDSDFFLSEPPYVLFDDCVFDLNSNALMCNIYSVEPFLQMYKARKEMLSICYMLLHNSYFEQGYFNRFFNDYKISTHYYHRINGLLQWLQNQNYESVLKIVFRYIRRGDEQKCHAVLESARARIFGQKIDVLSLCLHNKQEVMINTNDPQFFEKGVLCKHISIKYIDLYLRKTYVFYPQVEDFETEDALLPSLSILRYAFDLLTNFKCETFTYIGREGQKVKKRVINSVYSITKPVYHARDSPFENGWIDLPDFFLHFINETLPGLPIHLIKKLPANCQLFMIALVWLKIHTSSECERDIGSLLLSYLRVGVLGESHSTNAENFISVFDMTGDRLDERLITEHERKSAVEALASHYPSPSTEIPPYDKRFLHPFAQFQACLEQLNMLNELCGRAYPPTTLHAVYNGSFVYSVSRWIHAHGARGTHRQLMDDLMAGARSVSRFYASLFEVFETCVGRVLATNMNRHK